jgi:glycosyltransferase involved in cell wall biosynthesis
MHDEPFYLSENPKVSVVIPLYNCRHIVSRAIKSIQNQNMLNLEIILVDDFSTDDTLSYIEIMQKEDPRIKVIKNKKNMGILYSRSIGTLSAKGRYIFPLDDDDMFLDKDVFQTITNIADKGNFDIVEFKGIMSLLSDDDILNRRIRDISHSDHELNLVLFQPKLGAFPFTEKKKKDGGYNGYNIITVFLWGKCIKTKIYQKALNKFGKERYSRYMIRHEDIVAIYILFNTAESYKFVGKYGIFHIHRGDSASKKIDRIEINLYNLYFTDAVLDFSQNISKNKNLEISLVISLLDNNKLYEILKYRDFNYNLKLFISCLDRILNSKYILDNKKNEIKSKIKKWNFLNYSC